MNRVLSFRIKPFTRHPSNLHLHHYSPSTRLYATAPSHDLQKIYSSLFPTSTPDISTLLSQTLKFKSHASTSTSNTQSDLTSAQAAPVRVRFAPSPTGSLHVGGARTALYNWLLAQKSKQLFASFSLDDASESNATATPTATATAAGTSIANDNDNDNAKSSFLLRIEDTDLARSTRSSETDVLNDLKWLGLDYDEGPSSLPSHPTGHVGDNGPYRQSERNEIYKCVARHLLESGYAYPCFSTSEELEVIKTQNETLNLPNRYDGKWRDASSDDVRAELEKNSTYTIRFKCPPPSESTKLTIIDKIRGPVTWSISDALSDFIIMRSTGVPVYNFCVSVDDLLMGVTSVVRAEEHLSNTVKQCLVIDALEATLSPPSPLPQASLFYSSPTSSPSTSTSSPSPGSWRPEYAHTSLILGSDKQKLSKRHGATSVGQFKKEGFVKEGMINYLALLGWNEGGGGGDGGSEGYAKSDDFSFSSGDSSGDSSGNGNAKSEIYTVQELIQKFSLSRVVKSPATFDIVKLRWVNQQHLKLYSVLDLEHLVMEQMYDTGLLLRHDSESETGEMKEMKENKKRFTLASITLAKQFMETTIDPCTNTRKILSYNLPKTYADALTTSDPEVLKIIIQPAFYSVAHQILTDYDNHDLPLPDPAHPLASFVTDDNLPLPSTSTSTTPHTYTYITTETTLGGNVYAYPKSWKVYVSKTLAKKVSVKGKDLFHPIRLALTGEISGQEVSKQLGLVCLSDCVGVKGSFGEGVEVVGVRERLERLRDFVESFPVEMRGRKEKVLEVKKSNGNAGESTIPSSELEPGVSSSASAIASSTSTYTGPIFTSLDIRIGKIQSCAVHPSSQKLYISQIDLGQTSSDGTTPVLRQVCSGLQEYVSIEEMVGRKVLVLCNLKERKLGGVGSHGMILCGSNEAEGVMKVKVVNPPVDSIIGERVFVDASSSSSSSTGGDEDKPMTENYVAKKKIFEKMATVFKTDQNGVVLFDGLAVQGVKGACVCEIREGNVS